jgi:hypothetical protein
MTITLQHIEAKQTELAELIAKFKAQPQDLPAIISFSAEIALAAGERYAGLLLAEDGSIAHHLVLLPGEAEDVSWSAAVEWAEKAGGALPTRQEQALLYANLKSEFKPEWYWSGEEHETSSYAWYQTFHHGNQIDGHKGFELRARAVRRLPA